MNKRRKIHRQKCSLCDRFFESAIPIREGSRVVCGNCLAKRLTLLHESLSKEKDGIE